MSHIITFVRREGQTPVTVNAPGYDDRTARVMAGALAALTRRVVLSRVDEDGIPEPIARWDNGSRRRVVLASSVPPISPTIIDAEPGEDENILADQQAAQEALDAMSIAQAAEDSDNEMQTQNAYCMKCHEKRDVRGTVTITDNGRRQFHGPCPVCHREVYKFLPGKATQPEPEWSEDEDTIVLTDEGAEEAEEFEEAEPTEDESDEFVEDEEPEEGIPGIIHILQKDDAGRGKVRLYCSCDKWETTVKANSAAEVKATAMHSEHAAEADEDEGPAEEPVTEAAVSAAEPSVAEVVAAVTEAVPDAPAEDVAAAAVAAVEFSHEEKPAPRKRAPRKAKATAPEPPAESIGPLADEEQVAKARAARKSTARTKKEPPATVHCTYCGNNVPVKVSGDGKLWTAAIHAKSGGDPAKEGRCTGSQATVGADGKMV